MAGRHQPTNGADSSDALAWEQGRAMDAYLDNLETLFLAISQRPMTRDQAKRFGRLLGGADRAMVERGYRHGITR